MSFFDDASLVFLPSGQAGKDGKAYSMKPTNGDGDFTFSRGSNLTATRVDSNGLIEKGRENLITQSNDLSDFTPQGLTTTPNQADPFGGNNATLFTENLSGGNHRFYLLNVPSSSAVHTYSMYIKYSGRSRFKLVINGGNPNATFNTQTGAHITDSGNIIDYKTESIGNDWHRVSFASVCSGWVGGYFVNDSGQDSYTGDGTSGVVLFGAQVELGLVATEYIESGATTGLAGILEDSPRFDYSGGASCASLLLEPSRTNLLEYSEYFEGSGWTIQSGVTLTTNTTETLSPEGLYNATKAVGDGTNGIFNNASSSGSHARSVYLKSVSGTINIRISDPYAGGLAQIKSVTTEWQRFDMIGDTGGSNCGIFIDDIPSSGVYIWGAMLEQGSYPTSYIPNHSGGSVTREADSFEKTGLSSVIGQTEGTIFFEFEYSHQEINVPFFRVFEDTSNLYEIIALSSYKLRSRARIGGSIVAAIDTSSVVSEGTHKVAIIYKSRGYKFYLDGSLVGSSTENSIVSNPSEINYFNNNNNLKQFLVFPEALSEAECITLTTL